MSSLPTEEIHEAPGLLTEMLRAARHQPPLYQPGPYWRAKTEAAVRQIRRHGLNRFRGEESGLGTSFADNLYTDVRSTLDTRKGRPVKFIMERMWPFSGVFDSQVRLTRGYARDEVALLAARMSDSETARDLVTRYEVKNSLLGGCVTAARIGGQACSLHHVRTLHLIDHVRRRVDLDHVGVMFEIGGGFGALVQLMLDNFPRLRKVIYLDVVPNLYVGTCYLRTLFGRAVRDFSETSSCERVSFRDDDAVEILAIAPWQIEKLDARIDLLWNSNSFVEMPRAVVDNYARYALARSPSRSPAIVLSTYAVGGPNTLSPEELPRCFAGREFSSERFQALDRPVGYRSDADGDALWDTYLFVSPGEYPAPERPTARRTDASATC